MKAILAHTSAIMALSAMSDTPGHHDLMEAEDRRFLTLDPEDHMEIKQPPAKAQTGAQRAEQRELEKRRANLEMDRQRTLRNAETAEVDDVFFDGNGSGEAGEVGAVLVKGIRVGTWKLIDGEHVLFSNAGHEIIRRARQRDLKKAAAGLYVTPKEKRQPSRQVLRRRARKGW